VTLLRSILAAALSLATVATADAATTPNSAVNPQTPNRGILQFTNASTAGTYVTLYTAGANGSVCNALWMTNNDSAATHLVTVQLVNSTVKYGGVAETTVQSAGFTNANPAQSLLNPPSLNLWPGLSVDQNGNGQIYLASGDTLQATFATTITSGDVVNVGATCADF